MEDDLVSLDRKQGPKITWGPEQKVYLCCLYRFFRKDLKTFAKVFSFVFRAELAEAGFEDEAPSTRLYSRWRSMRDDGDPVWGPRLTTSQREVVSQGTQEQETSTPQNITSDQDDTPDMRPSATYMANTTTLVRCGNKACYWCHKERQEALQDDFNVSDMAYSAEIPPLLYRWANVDSQGINSKRLFVAGLGDNLNYFAPEEISTDQFKDHVLKHLNIEKRALWNEEGAIISIIDPKEIENPIFSAEKILRQLGERPHGWYTGVGEYLIWWKVPSSAIVCSFKASEVLQIAAKFPHISEVLQLPKLASAETSGAPLRRKLSQGPGKLDKETGLVIGNFLALVGVPHEYAPLVGEGMVKSWWMDHRGLSWSGFLDGLNEAYQFPISTIPATMSVSAIAEQDQDPTDTIFSDGMEDVAHEEPSTFIDDNDSITVSSSPEVASPERSSLARIERFNERTQLWVERMSQSQSQSPIVEVEEVSAGQPMLVEDVDQDPFETRRAHVRRFFN
ncbi:hypothetical protein FE257_012859 [Aspergillus nanangensis]|uniref:DUF7587 domain-containing protein n=1 Tax=Aspergillus nanangensis TaxID=2582783 RepID=A0AAD4CFF4_ASPNN|nr:hypothetical protein FE257_012859 [Aspergillus nanangensis]